MFKSAEKDSIEYNGTGPLLLSGPHGLRVNRNNGVKKAEIHITWLVKSLLEHLPDIASSLTWSEGLSGKHPLHREDPNYLLYSSLGTSKWHASLKTHRENWIRKANPWLIDLHGMGDHHGSDICIGLSPLLQHHATGNIAVQCRSFLENSFKSHLPQYKVYDVGFQASWKDNRHLTMSQQAVMLGMPAVQLELSLKLRTDLKANEQLLQSFEKVIRSFYECFRDVTLEDTASPSTSYQSEVVQRFPPC
jgi:hypothetical protein